MKSSLSWIDIYLEELSRLSQNRKSEFIHRRGRSSPIDPSVGIDSDGGLNDRFALGSFLAQTFLADSLDNEEMESRIDRSIAWLADNGMIERAGEDRKVAEREYLRLNIQRSRKKTGDDLPDWARVAGGLVRVENIQREALERRVISPRKGPAVFGFSHASDVERAVPES